MRKYITLDQLRVAMAMEAIPGVIVNRNRILQWVSCIDAHLAATKAQTVDVAEDADTLVRFIFSYFGDVSMSHHLSDEVVAAVRRIEAIRTNP